MYLNLDLDTKYRYQCLPGPGNPVWLLVFGTRYFRPGPVRSTLRTGIDRSTVATVLVVLLFWSGGSIQQLSSRHMQV